MSKDSGFEQNRKAGGQEPSEGLVIDQIRESAKAPLSPPRTEFERLQTMAAAMRTDARSEQMAMEQELQGALTTASEKVADAKRMEQIFALVDKVSQKLEEGASSIKSDPASFLHLVEQLQTKIGEQMAMTDAQVSRSLQQALSALARSQAALFQSKTLSTLATQAKEFEDSARLAAGISPDKDHPSKQLPLH